MTQHTETTSTNSRSPLERIAAARRAHGSLFRAFEATMERREQQRLEGQCPLKVSAASRGLGPTKTSSGRS